MKHKGEKVRLMSGEYGTVIVKEGDTYPEWFTPPGAAAADVSADETEPDEESD